MCNGRCLPVLLPCNGTCQDSFLLMTNVRLELFGPTANCTEGIEGRIWGFDPSRELKGEELCVPGSFPCAGECGVMDPRMPYLAKNGRARRPECVAQCDSSNEWPCEGKCIHKVR